MARPPVKRLAALLLVIGLTAAGCESGSGGGTSGGSGNGSSSGASSGDSNGTSGGGTSGGGTSDTTGPGAPGADRPGTGPPGTAPPENSPPPPPEGYTLPEPDDNGQVEVPEEPPPEVRDKPPRQRLRDLPPVPTSCLDSDLTLLDILAPFFSVPLRLVYCLLYVGTLARLPTEIDVTVDTPGVNADGGRVDVPVGLLPPDPRRQRPLATFALIVLLLVVAGAIGYYLGRRRLA